MLLTSIADLINKTNPNDIYKKNPNDIWKFPRIKMRLKFENGVCTSVAIFVREIVLVHEPVCDLRLTPSY